MTLRNYHCLYKQHSNGTIGSWEAWTDGSTVHTRACKLLAGKAVDHQYEAKGKNLGCANETTPAVQAGLEVESKVRLKLDKGYVKTLEEAKAPVTNALGLPKPMLATPLEKVKPEAIEWNAAFIQPKLDGHRAMYKDGVLYSRQGKVLEHMDHVVQAIKNSGLDDVHLDGELYVHGRPLQEVSRLIKKWTPESLIVEYHIYDQVAPVSFMQRMSLLADTFKETPWDSILQPVQTVPVGTMEMAQQWFDYYRAQGYEGAMLRFGTDTYGTDKRSRTLLKMKQFQDAEFKVVDVVEGKPYIKDHGTYQVPVWVCQTAQGGRFNVTACGTMEEKHAQWESRQELLNSGKDITVRYHYLSNDGIPQLPVMLGWREDL
jgi:DNA ligase-1